MEIRNALATAKADAARIAHFIERRERFLDALDWSLLTEDHARQLSMLDDLLEGDLADAILYVDWLVERLCENAAPIPGVLALCHIRARGTLNGSRSPPAQLGDQ